MANALLDPAVTQVASQINKLAARVSQLERNQRSGYNGQNQSIDNGGSIIFNDAGGNPAVVVGQQSDGTFAARQVGSVAPSKAPDTPIVSPGINGLYVAWDGLMADGTTPTADFAAVQVHVSSTVNFTPSSATLQGHMVGAGLFGVGGLTPGTTYYVALQAINNAGNLGPAGNEATGIPVNVPSGIPPGSINGLQIQTGTITGAQLAAAAGILGSQIAGATITSSNILAGSITAALLAAGLVIAGAVDATVITGASLRNSATDPKTSINSDGSISITDIRGTVIFKIGPDGTIYWYTPGGTILMELQPSGTQLIYASLTGPSGWDFEPPGPPKVLFQASSATSSATYANASTTTTMQGDCITVVASDVSTNTVTGVSDSQGNSYGLVRSVTTAPSMQVYQSSNSNPLGTTDTITVTYATATATEKNIIALDTPGVLTTTAVTDFSAPASGTSAAPSVSGTPSNYGDLLLFFLSNASAGGTPSALPDGWTQIGTTQQVSGNQYTSVYFSSNVSGSSQTASATIVSSAWSAIMLGLSAAPAAPASSNSPTGVNATLSQSTAWAGDGSLSLKINHSNTASGWGANFPAFPVQPGAQVSMSATIQTPTALSAISIGFTFYSGAGGTGSSLGTVSGDQGTLSTASSGIYAVSITGATVPAGAQSAVFFISEGAADAANTIYYIDVIRVPGGLLYTNSPTGGTDTLGNSYEQGINFVGLPGLTNVFGVEDPYGNQLMAIDGSGNIQGQTISAVKDLIVGGQSISTYTGSQPGGLLARGWTPGSNSSQWPSTAISGLTALLELDVTIPAGRAFQVVVPSTTILWTTAPTSNAQAVFHLYYTSDGSTPTTSSTEVSGHSPFIISAMSGAALNYMTPYTEYFPLTPTSPTTYRFLIAASAGGAGAFKFSNSLEMRIYDCGIDNGQFVSKGVTLGSGTSGGSGSTQTYTEYFYGNNTWSYYAGGPSQRNHNSNIYQGAYSGETDYQYSYIQFSTGSLGNALSTVLNYTGVNSVSFRLLNQHAWYDTGMIVGLHSSTSLGSTAYSTILTSYAINEGQQLTTVLNGSVWAPFKTAGTYMVLAPDSAHLHSLYWYGYFWGGGSNNSNVPAMIVNYTH